jgi:hypothetical protein
MNRRTTWEVTWITIKKNGIDIPSAVPTSALVEYTKTPFGGAAMAFPKRPTDGEEVK